MTFTLTIDCDNAAFCGDVHETPDSVTAGYEVARILHDAAKHVANGDEERSLMDSNGNRVGGYSFTD